jgi:hypothetical protein
MLRSNSTYVDLILDDQRIGSRFPSCRSNDTWFVSIKYWIYIDGIESKCIQNQMFKSDEKLDLHM